MNYNVSVKEPEERKANGAFETILVTRQGKVGLITLNRPHALNALNAQLIGELNRAIEAFEADSSIGCIVITGNEKAFAAGVDIKEMHKKTFVEAYGSDILEPFDNIEHYRKKLATAIDETARQNIAKLLAEEEAKLTEFRDIGKKDGA